VFKLCDFKIRYFYKLSAQVVFYFGWVKFNGFGFYCFAGSIGFGWHFNCFAVFIYIGEHYGLLVIVKMPFVKYFGKDVVFKTYKSLYNISSIGFVHLPAFFTLTFL